MLSFSLITLNSFGVPAPSTRSRLYAVAQELNRMGADVICLQEMQMHAYRRLMIRACTSYDASFFEPFLHAPKGGLLTLSRLPIQESEFTLFRERGLWYTPAIADWILHKGVLCTCLALGNLSVIVLNTHLTANYTANWSRQNRYARAEHKQLRHLAEIVREQSPEALVIVAGDFNTPRGSWLYEEFIAASGLTDPLAGDTRPTLRPPAAMPA